MTERCALYFAPQPDSPLAAFAAAWFGRADNREITASPRHYGFHATLKPPFRFAAGTDIAALQESLRAFAAEQPPVALGPVTVDNLSGFLALVPLSPPPDLERLAEACVARFDSFRAAPGEAELARRRSKGLSPRQEQLLSLWGYPYVFDQFRWHMTLTAKLPDAERDRWHAELRRLAAPALQDPLAIDSLSIFRQPAADRPFAEIDRVSLTGTRQVQTAVSA